MRRMEKKKKKKESGIDRKDGDKAKCFVVLARKRETFAKKIINTTIFYIILYRC